VFPSHEMTHLKPVASISVLQVACDSVDFYSAIICQWLLTTTSISSTTSIYILAYLCILVLASMDQA